jgi:hypothetical protein
VLFLKTDFFKFNNFCHGDQMGLIFAQRWMGVYFGQFFKIHKKAKFWTPFSTVKTMYLLWQKMDWATFWAIFLQANSTGHPDFGRRLRICLRHCEPA